MGRLLIPYYSLSIRKLYGFLFHTTHMFLHVIDAEYDEKYQLKLKFNNGAEGIVDLEEELHGEVFEPLKDLEEFRKFKLTSRTIEWPNGADFAPEYLLEIAPLTTEPTVERIGNRTPAYG